MRIDTYNQAGQLTRLLNQVGGNTLSDFSSVAYDAVGNRTSITASIPGATALNGVTNYQYDIKNQLSQEQSTRNGGFTDGFGYDPAGNPTSFKGISKNYNSNNQQTGTGFAYDGNGNPTTYNVTTLTFDSENRMTSYGSVLTAGYTGDGVRAWKQNSSGRIYFFYDGIVPIVEMDSSGAVTATNSFGASGLISRRSGGNSVFYIFDGGGTVAQRSDASGSVLSNYLFSAHGSLISGSLGEPFGYKAQFGYYTDSETGLQLLTHRYYDPNTGRFLTRDPIQYSGGINLYGYVTNNPINLLDSLGLDGWGNDLADWLDARIDYAQRFWQYGAQEWVANGINNSVSDVARGAVDVLRVGSGSGHALFDSDDNAYGRAAGVAQDVTRAAAIFNLLGGTVARPSPGRGATWPRSAKEMDEFLGFDGRCIPDGPNTPGRGKVEWKPSDKVKITLEQHPYDVGSPPSHAGPHWHLGTPGKPHARYLPGEPIP